MPKKPTYNEAVTLEFVLQQLLATRSATDLARELDVGQSTVSRWAKGELVPELWRADAIAKVTNRDTGEVETLIFQAKRGRGRPAVEQRVAHLEDKVEALTAAVHELRELLRSAPG